MDEPSGIGKLLRDLNQAYMDGLATISNAVTDLGKRRIPDAERQIERWIGVARAAKDGYVAAIDQGFAMWEKRLRQMMTPDRSKSDDSGRAPSGQLDAWLDEWKKANESFTQTLRDSGLGEEAMKQAKEFRKTFESGLKSLQKLWQSGGESTRK